MKITIDRTHCDACTSFCDRHVARIIHEPLSQDRPCIQLMEDDGRPELTLVVKDHQDEVTLHLSEEDRAIMGLEGISAYLPWIK